jgi:hypothetical protein
MGCNPFRHLGLDYQQCSLLGGGRVGGRVPILIADLSCCQLRVSDFGSESFLPHAGLGWVGPTVCLAPERERLLVSRVPLFVPTVHSNMYPLTLNIGSSSMLWTFYL